MKLKRVLNALTKNGATVTVLSEGYSYSATKGKNVLHFYENGRNSGSVLNFTYKHPDTNASVDLFMDSYFDTIKGAIHFLNSP